MTGIWLRLLRLLRWRASEREIDEELRFHLDMEADRHRRAGVDPAEARRRALVALGGLDRWREEVRAARGTAWIEDTLRDLRFAARGLMRSPAFAAVAIGAIALGVGATTAIYSVVDQVVLSPLAYPQSDQLVTVWRRNPRQGTQRGVTSWPDFVDWRAATTTLAGMATVLPARYTLSGAGEPEEVLGASVSAGFFRLIGAPLALGRSFRGNEVEPNVGHTVVLSYELFSRRFGADPSVVGRTIRLNGAPYEVVGVARPGEGYPRGAELWTPQAFGTNRVGMYPRWRLLFPVVGRLKDGVTLSRAQTQMDVIAKRLEAAHPEADRGVSIMLEPLRNTIVGDVRTPLFILLGAVAAVLLIAVVNVANLLLARGTVRARELAARLALGAGQGRIVRQVLAESALLGGAGGLVGAALAYLGVSALVAAGPVDLPRLDEVHPNWLVLGFALAVALGASVVFGLVPALHAGRVDPATNLRESTRVSSSGGLGRARGAFVAAQFALALVLLVGSGLLLRSFLNLRAVDPGFDPEGVLSVSLHLAPDRYPDEESRHVFQRELLDAVSALPGVESVGTTSSFFVGDEPRTGTPTVEGRTGQFGPDRQVPVVGADVSPGFFATVGMKIVAGRGFEETDGPQDVPVAVVNETFARIFLAGLDPVGQRFTWLLAGKNTYWFTIVGVVEDARRSGLAAPVRPTVFNTTGQASPYQFEVLVRTAGAPLRLAPAVRRAVHQIDADVPVFRVRTLEQAMVGSLAERRFVSWLLGVFALAALLLAVIGVFGVMAYGVGRRRREIGIRVALGATRSRLVAEVLREGLLQAGVGLLLGVFTSLALTPLIRSQLYGLHSTDPVTFATASVVLLLAAVAACILPARRAASVDAMVVLREE